MSQDDLRWLYRDEGEETRRMPERGYPEREPFPASEPAAEQPPRPARRAQYVQEPPIVQRTKRPRKRRGPVGRTVLTLLLLWVLFLVGTPLIALFRIGTVDGLGDKGIASQPGTAVLLVGSDGRDDLSDEDRRRLGTGSTEGRRTDSMMLLYTAPNGQSIILGLPRDSYVKIPGKGKNKLNAAYAFGGAPLLMETVEDATGIQVDGYLEIGMLGLVNMVDAVGGIEVCPEKAMKDRDSHLDIPAGCQQLDGVTALAYARMRKADPKGDLGRMERQREVIGKVVGKAISPMSVINPVRWWNLNMAVAGTLHRSDETGVVTMGAAGMGLVNQFFGRGTTLTVPVANANYRTNAGSSVLWDKDKAEAVFAQIRSGDVSKLVEESE